MRVLGEVRGNEVREFGSIRENYGRVTRVSRVIEEKESKDRWALGKIWGR